MNNSIFLVLAFIIFFLINSNDHLNSMDFQVSTEYAAETEKTAGTQAIMDQWAARLTLPGKAHYDKACATCHEGAVAKAPHREMLYLLTPESHYSAMTDGVMAMQASSLTDKEKIEVAEFLGGQAMGTASSTPIPNCPEELSFDLDDVPKHNNWGVKTNQRNLSSYDSGIPESLVTDLEPLWALKLPDSNRLRSQPAMAGGFLFVGSHSGGVYALDQKSGCQIWHFKTAGEVRTGISIDSWEAGDHSAEPLIYFGDAIGNVYAVKARSGKLSWRDRADKHPNATITGAPALSNGVLYTPVSSLEVQLAVNPHYECCTGRGSVVAYDAATGARKWKTFTIPEEPTVQYVNEAGAEMYGPSGSTVWNSPTIDVPRNQLYVGTGENMSSPADHTSDAIFAMDLTTGKVNWIYQATEGDAWNTACDTRTPQSCPEENGPDFDFGAGTMLITTKSNRQLVVAGQKSGDVHAVDPETGELAWTTRVGRGGIQGGVHFGMAADKGKIYVPISDGPDGRAYEMPARPGLHALDAETGEILWYSAAPIDVCRGRNFCDPGVGQAISIISGQVFAGGMDGVMRAHDQDSGEVLFQIDTTNSFETITGENTRGGSFGGASGATANNGLMVLSSGYGIYNHMPGNLLLVLGTPTN